MFRVYVKFYQVNKCIIYSIDSYFGLIGSGEKDFSKPVLPLCLSSSLKTLRSNYQPGTAWFSNDSANLAELRLFYSVSLRFPSLSHSTFIFALPRHVMLSRSVSLQQGVFFSFVFNFCIVMSCACVCVFLSCTLRESFRLIKEMIYRSMMLEEFPDRSSNRVFSNELSPLNHSQPQKRLAPETLAYLCTHTFTVHPRS